MDRHGRRETTGNGPGLVGCAQASLTGRVACGPGVCSAESARFRAQSRDPLATHLREPKTVDCGPNREHAQASSHHVPADTSPTAPAAAVTFLSSPPAAAEAFPACRRARAAMTSAVRREGVMSRELRSHDPSLNPPLALHQLDFKTEGESTISQRAWRRPEGGWWAFVRRLACVAV